MHNAMKVERSEGKFHTSSASIIGILMMAAETVSETLDRNFILTQLIAREVFSVFSRSENFKSCDWTVRTPSYRGMAQVSSNR
jgi:hypothetical protein